MYQYLCPSPLHIVILAYNTESEALTVTVGNLDGFASHPDELQTLQLRVSGVSRQAG